MDPAGPQRRPPRPGRAVPALVPGGLTPSGAPSGPLGPCEEYLDFAEHEGQRYRLMFGGLRDTSTSTRDARDTGALVDGSVGMASFDLLAEAVGACAQAVGLEDSDPVADSAALWVGLHGFALLRLTNPGFPWPEGLVLRLQEQVPGVGQTGASSGAT